MKDFPYIRRNVQFRRGLVAAGAATAAVGGLAGWVTHRAREAERASPPRGQFVTVDGVRIHYLQRGQGTPVVLLHGNVLRAEDFVASGLMAQLATNHRVIAFDRPGYGYTERPPGRLWTAEAQAALLQRALAQLGVTQPIVVGHSWGALVALELALLPGAAVSKLILVSGYYFPTARGDVAMVAPTAIPLLGTLLRYTTAPVFARMTLTRTVKKIFAPMPVPEDFMPLLDREMLLRPQQLQADAQDAVFMIPAAAHVRKRYDQITAPVTIFAGEDDGVVDVEQARRLHEEVRGSELTVLPGVGHMAHYAAAQEIVAAINRQPTTN